MESKCKNALEILEYSIAEIDKLETLINMIKVYCYYVPSGNSLNKTQADCLNSLEMSLEKVATIKKNNFLIEKELCILQNDSHNCGR